MARMTNKRARVIVNEWLVNDKGIPAPSDTLNYVDYVNEVRRLCKVEKEHPFDVFFFRSDACVLLRDVARELLAQVAH